MLVDRMKAVPSKQIHQRICHQVYRSAGGKGIHFATFLKKEIRVRVSKIINELTT
jgi:fructose-1-phosphate kinase PfkB-like protein